MGILTKLQLGTSQDGLLKQNKMDKWIRFAVQ